MKHQMRGATQAQQGMTLLITLLSSGIMYSIILGVIDPLHGRNEFDENPFPVVISLANLLINLDHSYNLHSLLELVQGRTNLNKSKVRRS